jgi:hypothetical protein
MFLGEFPPLPPDVIRALHRRTMDAKVRLVDQAWELMADSAVVLFEGWKKMK